MPHEQCEEAKRPRITPTLCTPSAADMDEHTFAQPELVCTLCGGRGLGENAFAHAGRSWALHNLIGLWLDEWFGFGSCW